MVLLLTGALLINHGVSVDCGALLITVLLLTGALLIVVLVLTVVHY